MKYSLFIFFITLSFHTIALKAEQYKVALIGFYNLENLFDTINQPEVQDEEFTPLGANRYTAKVYLDKLGKLEQVISEMGMQHSPDGIALLGVAEIENASVLKDLVNMPKLENRNYQIAHIDGKDERGIDCALLYNPKYFTVTRMLSLHLPTEKLDSAYGYTRDILFVSGFFLGEPLHVFVNHWPSRRGGEEKTAPYRQLGAAVCKEKIDSLLNMDANVKYIVMGDLNDNPTDPSVAKVLNAKKNIEEVKDGGMFNPWIKLYKSGIGTLAYQDSWSLFDQIIISSSYLNTNQKGYFYKEPVIFKKEYMLQKTGRYKGYPFRTFNGSVYQGGYSDHFPTYLVFLKVQK